MALCAACGWEGSDDDLRDVSAVDPGLCPDCLSTAVDAHAPTRGAETDADQPDAGGDDGDA